jgi:hypothetical protein
MYRALDRLPRRSVLGGRHGCRRSISDPGLRSSDWVDDQLVRHREEAVGRPRQLARLRTRPLRDGGGRGWRGRPAAAGQGRPRGGGWGSTIPPLGRHRSSRCSGRRCGDFRIGGAGKVALTQATGCGGGRTPTSGGRDGDCRRVRCPQSQESHIAAAYQQREESSDNCPNGFGSLLLQARRAGEFAPNGLYSPVPWLNHRYYDLMVLREP